MKRCLFPGWKFSLGLLVITAFQSQVAVAQQVDGSSLVGVDNRSGMSGQQLFDHDWVVTASDPTKNAALVTRTGSTNPVPPGTVFGDGLGPLHNATSCKACHEAGGAAGVRHNVTMITVDPRSPAILALQGSRTQLLRQLKNVPQQAANRTVESSVSDFQRVFPGLVNSRGVLVFETVVHNQSTRGAYDVIRNGLSEFVPNGLDNAWFSPHYRTSEAIAKQPVIAGRFNDVDFYLSQRSSPPLFGLAAIDSVNLTRLVALAERQSHESNGVITGRVAGKFGWRGQMNSLAEFVSGACAGELGLTQGRNGQADDPTDPTYVNLGKDMSDQEVTTLVSYVASLPRPTEYSDQQHSAKHLLSGERLFATIGCSACHVPDLPPVTGMFSDLLLHDMGERLQAASPAPMGPLKKNARSIRSVQVSLPSPTRQHVSTGFYGFGSELTSKFPAPYDFARPAEPQFPRGQVPDPVANLPTKFDDTWDMLQREWRTPPLWGIADTGPYLHDGRAETLADAIDWHGGEAKHSRAAYDALADTDKTLVIDFLSSLHAPKQQLE